MNVSGRDARIIGIVVVLLLVLGGSALQFRAQRDHARADATRNRAMLADSRRDAQLLRTSAQVTTSSNAHLVDEIANLNAQIAWDKSHLLDCWVLIQRIAPRGLLSHDLATYPVAAEHTARSTATLVDRCASDALP